MLFKLAHYFVKVMLLVVMPNYSHIIKQVVDAQAILQYLPYYLLEFLCCHVNTKQKVACIDIRMPSGAANMVMSCVSGWSSI